MCVCVCVCVCVFVCGGEGGGIFAIKIPNADNLFSCISHVIVSYFLIIPPLPLAVHLQPTQRGLGLPIQLRSWTEAAAL